ncbi:hypothetical protein UlMin_006612 [Ulmus minor]
MEVEEVKSNLLALRQLYGLLECCGGTLYNMRSLSLENACKLLDKRALQVFKNLLDDARESLSKALANAIKQIDSHILAFESPLKKSTSPHLELLKKSENQVGESSSSCKPTLKSKTTSGFSGLKVKAMVERIESMNKQRVSQTNQTTCYVHGFRVPLSQDAGSGMSSALPKKLLEDQTCGKNPIKNNPTVGRGSTRKEGKSRPSIEPQFVDCKKNQRRRAPESTCPSQINMGPTLLGYESTSCKNGKRKNENKNKKIKPLQPEIEETSYTQSSTTNPNSVFPSDSGSYSVQSYTRSSATTVDQSEESKSFNSSRRSSSSPGKTYLRREKKNSEKTIGRLRRIKNKLGLIFHHHHHHHHHHHDNNRNPLEGHKRSSWKHLQKIFHGKSREKKIVHGQEVGKKDRKSVVKHDKKGAGNVNALAKGLLGQVGRPRNSKAGGKGGMQGLRPRNMKAEKRFNWWHLLRHGGVKLPNRRGRVKLGFGNARPKLKMK